MTMIGVEELTLRLDGFDLGHCDQANCDMWILQLEASHKAIVTYTW
jgi:hypothetical protein